MFALVGAVEGARHVSVESWCIFAVPENSLDFHVEVFVINFRRSSIEIFVHQHLSDLLKFNAVEEAHIWLMIKLQDEVLSGVLIKYMLAHDG